MSAAPARAARSGGVRRGLRMTLQQVRYEQLSFWRNPVGGIFTIGFSVVFLVLLGASSGNSRISYLGDIRQVEYYVPGFAAYGVMAACFNTLAITVVVRREMGLLKRIRLSPLPAWAMLGALFANSVIVSTLQVVALLVIGRTAYNVGFPHDVAAFIVTLVVGAACFTALGVAMSTVIPNQESAGPVTAIVFFVLLFLSGLWYPLKAGSGLAQVSAWFPVRHLIVGVFTAFAARPGVSPWAWHDLLAMGAWGVGGTVLAIRRFRWEPRRS
ncbi:MAG: ABC transporter permease [Acidimicrobiales bacterium]